MPSFSFIISGSGANSAVPNQFRALAQELVARGHNVVHLYDGQARHLEKHEGNPRIFTWPSRRPTKLRDARFLRKIVHEYQPHCVIANFASVNGRRAVECHYNRDLIAERFMRLLEQAS